MSRLDNRSLRILLFFLVLTGLPLAALSWLGWQFLQQDRDLELQRQQEQLENVSELLARDLQTHLESVERSLRARGGVTQVANAAFFRLHAGRVVERSGVSLPFYPMAPVATDSGATVFVAAERLEFVDGRCDLALDAYRRFAVAPQAEVRAGALMRLARCLKKLGRNDDALEAYTKLGTLRDTATGGMPAELLARRERIMLLASAGHDGAARVEENRLREALVSGHFAIDHGTFEFMIENLSISAPAIAHLPLALAADEWSSRWQGDTCGRLAGRFAGRSVLSLWCRSDDDGVQVMLAPAEAFLERLSQAAQSMQTAAAVNDEGGNTLWGAVPAPSAAVVRHLSDLALPWQLRVSSADPAHADTSISRRRAFAASGLTLMVGIVLASAFFVFRAVNRELEIARLQADFIGTVSHEFRTPLTAMNHLTEMLQESAVPEERVPQYYTALHRETHRLQRVVEGLLDFRRFESGRGAYRMEPLDAQDTVRQVLENFTAPDDSRRLRVSMGGSSAMFCGDRAAVAAAISNLLDNALKYSPRESPVSIQVETRGSMVGISVEDRGPGMTRDERRRVFRKFVRGAAAHEGSVKGTGIGLAIVEAVVKAHGGRIDLHTVPGQGSRFTLLLPRA